MNINVAMNIVLIVKDDAYSFYRFSAFTLQLLYGQPVCCNNIFIRLI